MLAGGFALAGRVLIERSKEVLSEQIDKQGLALVRSSAVQCLDPALSRDYPVLDELAQQMVDGENGVLEFSVELGENGDVVAEARTQLSSPELAHARRFSEAIVMRSEDGRAPDSIGTVRLTVSGEIIVAAERKLIRALLLCTSLLFVALALANVTIVRRLVGRPLLDLDQQVHAVSNDLEQPIRLHSGGELIRIAESVEKLRMRMLGARSELQVRTERVEKLSAEKDAMLADLERAVHAARAADRLKTSFLANTSHEIRTPLNAILGLSEMMGSKPMDEESREWLGLLRQSGQALLSIVENVLDITQIEAGEMSLERCPVQLSEALPRVLDTWRALASDNHVELHIELDPGAPAWVLTDGLRLRQVLSNLVGNAIKFSSDGRVNLRVGPAAARPSSRGATHRLRFEVEDNGIGISEEAREYIFEPFRQADESMTRAFGGTGLGLSITRRIVERLGGVIEVESTPGQGSTFRFELDFASCHEPNPFQATRSEPELPGQGLLVLVVDDNPVNRRVACALLKRFGYWSIEAKDGVEAVEHTKIDGPDLILMDCQMPRMDGYEATGAIRDWEGQEQRARVPIVALTANALPNERARCLAAGMDEYVVKPFKPADLLATIESMIQRAREAA